MCTFFFKCLLPSFGNRTERIIALLAAGIPATRLHGPVQEVLSGKEYAPSGAPQQAAACKAPAQLSSPSAKHAKETVAAGDAAYFAI